MINEITQWIEKAVPNPSERNQQIQLGVHFEEVAEMLDAIGASDLARRMYNFADGLKKDKFQIPLEQINRGELLDALADQIVTATAVGYMFGMKLNEAVKEVNRSNWSKFDENNNPIFDENGKVSKGPNYSKPNLTGMF